MTTSQKNQRQATRIAFAAVVLAMLPAVLDQTMLATGLPTIAADLGRVSDVSWVVTAYVVAAAATTPLWGKLGDRHGRKRLLELALALFLAASAVCGAAQDITALLLTRLVQGVAAGGLMTLAMAAVGDLVSPRQRGRYQGYIATTFAVATVAGPLLGGLLVQHTGWRWVFFVNLPVGLLALVGLRLRFPASPVDADRRPLDVGGSLLLAGATSCLLLACIWGGQRYAWGSATIIALLVATAALAGALAARELRAADPIVPLALLRIRSVAVSSPVLFLATGSLFAINVFIPLYLQATTGATPIQAGLLLVPLMLGITVSSNLSGRLIERSGRYKRFPVVGLALMTTALALLAVLVPHPSRTSVGVGLAVFGLGFGMVGQVLIVAVQNSVDRRQLGTAMATTNFFRGLGGAVGAAALGTVFAVRAGAIPDGAAVAHLTSAARTDIIDAVQAVFLVAAPVAALALLLVLLLDEKPLQGPESGRTRRSGLPRPRCKPTSCSNAGPATTASASSRSRCRRTGRGPRCTITTSTRPGTCLRAS